MVHLDNLPVPVLRRHDDENAFCFYEVDNNVFRNVLLLSGVLHRISGNVEQLKSWSL